MNSGEEMRDSIFVDHLFVQIVFSSQFAIFSLQMADVVDTFTQDRGFVRLCLFRSNQIAQFRDFVVDRTPCRVEETKNQRKRSKQASSSTKVREIDR